MNLYLAFILSCLMFFSCVVVFSKDTIKSLISLIICFILSSFCFVLLGAEFLAFVLLIVYGGAISILFLFIIMLLIKLCTTKIFKKSSNPIFIQFNILTSN